MEASQENPSLGKNCPVCRKATSRRMNRQSGSGRVFCPSCGWEEGQESLPSNVRRATVIGGQQPKQGVNILAQGRRNQ